MEIVLESVVPNPHLDLVALGRRGFKWEIIKQLVEEYWIVADPMEDVKGDREVTYPKYRMVLQFQQGPHFYRLAFNLFLKTRSSVKKSYQVVVMTMFHDGTRPALDCGVQMLDGTYDLPTENIP